MKLLTFDRPKPAETPKSDRLTARMCPKIARLCVEHPAAAELIEQLIDDALEDEGGA